MCQASGAKIRRNSLTELAEESKHYFSPTCPTFQLSALLSSWTCPNLGARGARRWTEGWTKRIAGFAQRFLLFLSSSPTFQLSKKKESHSNGLFDDLCGSRCAPLRRRRRHDNRGWTGKKRPQVPMSPRRYGVQPWVDKGWTATIAELERTQFSMSTL
jgi:hypothetical protein